MIAGHFSFAQTGQATNSSNVQVRQLENFNGIQMNVPAVLTISQAVTYSVRLEGRGEIMDQVITEVKGKKLVIRSKDNKWKGGNDNSLHIFIELPQLNYLDLNGSGDVVAATEIVSDNMELEVNGSGNISLQKVTFGGLKATINGSGDIFLAGGNVRESSFLVNGSGNIDCNQLSIVQVTAMITGSGNIATGNVTSIDAAITGSGNISYKGTDVNVKKRVTGSGKLIAK